jgi:hypothetical protein
MKTAFLVILLLGVTCAAQVSKRSAGSKVASSWVTTSVANPDDETTINRFASAPVAPAHNAAGAVAKQQPRLSVVCGAGEESGGCGVFLDGAFTLKANGPDGAFQQDLRLDGAVVSVQWKVDRQQTTMSAITVGGELLATRLRHARSVVIEYETQDGVESAEFSLVGLDGEMLTAGF